MRFVFEFRGTPQVAGFGKRRTGLAAKPPEWHGVFVDELLISDMDDETNEEGDVVFLSGKLESLRHALKSALEVLDAIEEVEKEDFARDKANSLQCTKCLMYYNRRFAHEGHGDGKGNKCLPPLD